jgi:hypothetical protein
MQPVRPVCASNGVDDDRLQRSAPQLSENWATSVSPYRSTTAPGKPSDSLNQSNAVALNIETSKREGGGASRYPKKCGVNALRLSVKLRRAREFWSAG